MGREAGGPDRQADRAASPLNQPAQHRIPRLAIPLGLIPWAFTQPREAGARRAVLA